MMKHIEIENKYLLHKEKALEFLSTLKSVTKRSIEQMYIKYTDNEIKRVRRIGDRYILTVKRGKGKIREEFEKDIDKKEYKKLSKKRIGYKIVKDRYIFELEGKTYELDIFKKKFQGLAFLEIEFKDIDELNRFTPPSKIEYLIQKDVSEDRSYTNAYLALKKYQNIDLESYFKEIDGFDCQKNDIKIGKQSNLLSFLSIKLYLYNSLIKCYIKSYKISNDDESLHQIRVNIRKIRSLLSLHKELFQNHTVKKIELSLKEIVKTTNKKRDLDVFLHYLISKKFKNEEFLSYLKKEASKEHDKIMKLLNSKKFLQTLEDIEFFILHLELYSFDSVRLPAIRYGKKKIKNSKQKIKKDFKRLKNNTPIEKFHKVRIEIKRLRYLMEFYNIKKDIKSIVKHQNDFGKLNDFDKQIEITKEYLSSSQEKDVLKLLKTLKKRLKDIKKSIIS